MKKNKEVHIVGFAPSSRDQAGYNNDLVDVWVLNEYFTILPQHGANNINRWFEIHQRDTVLNSHRAKDYLIKLQESKVPIMMVKKYDDIPMSQAYPLDEIIKALDTDYFTNSISYMIALAIHEGYEKIGLYGIDMAQDEEYAKERPSVEYFVGYARAKGIEVYIPSESDICKVPYYYGFQEESASKISKTLSPKQKDLTDRITNDDLMVDEMLEHMDYYLKKYLFDIKPTVELIKADNIKAIELEKKMVNMSQIERQEAINKIHELKNKNIPLYEMEQVINKTWESLQKLKGCKKERLFLAGARDVVEHTRKILCPFD